MQLGQSAVWILIDWLLSIDFVYAGISNWDACSGRLERALDALQRDSTRRNKLDEEEAGMLYQRELNSAPLEMSVSRMAVKLPENTKEFGSNYWARVERCVYEPERNSLRTRVVFNNLSVSGMVSLMSRDHHAAITAASCRMMLRLRRAGIDFLTSPIARGRGQMRIRTESSFLEPRFVSIYAYGCHPTRLDKQIKRQDKWPPYHSIKDHSNEVTLLKPPPPPPTSMPLPLMDDKYDVAEPRQSLAADMVEQVDVPISNESQYPRYSHTSETNFGVWRKNSWITKLPPLRQERSTIRHRFARATTHHVVTSRNFANAARAVIERKPKKENTTNFTMILNLTHHLRNEDALRNVTSRQVRELIANDSLDNLFLIDSEDPNTSWRQSKERIAREMEDVFLQGASQALTRYIERQLHPAIKETLMLSMGYTISYG